MSAGPAVPPTCPEHGTPMRTEPVADVEDETDANFASFLDDVVHGRIPDA